MYASSRGDFTAYHWADLGEWGMPLVEVGPATRDSPDSSKPEVVGRKVMRKRRTTWCGGFWRRLRP